MAHTAPSDVELQVLSILWERGPSTVHDVREAMPDGKARAYTTVLTVMQNMEKKALITHSQQGQANIYRPLVKRQQVLKPLMKSMLANVFGGNRSALMRPRGTGFAGPFEGCRNPKLGNAQALCAMFDDQTGLAPRTLEAHL